MANPVEKKYQHLIGKRVSVRVKLQGSTREMPISGTMKEERVVYGRHEVGLKIEGHDDVQWFAATKLITP